jgi:hypothetical protein
VGTLDFIESLKTETNPVTAMGTDVALVRRMLLIDNQGEPVLSPLVKPFKSVISIQAALSRI